MKIEEWINQIKRELVVKQRRDLMKMKKLSGNNKGMTLVTVIVAIGFIATLVGILLMTTLVNFKMKSTNTRGKDTFYSAEQVLDEITVGLQRRVSDSLSSSYVEVLENYGEYDNTKKKELVETRYYEKIWSYLEVSGSGHQKYSVDTLEAFLKDTTKWHDIDSDGDGTADNGYGAIIMAVADDGTESKEGPMITYLDNGIVLKNIKVYYKDALGFVSIIQTDIRLNYPAFDFATSSMMSDITSYTFIADGGMENKSNGTMNIKGNVYANNFLAEKVKVEVEPENLMIVKYDLNVKGGSLETKKDNVIWAKNIKAESATLSLNGDMYISNDLNILGKNSNVTLKGKYYGYGVSQTDSTESSAILINGKKTILNMFNLTELTVAGHAYLGTSDIKKSDMADYHLDGMTDEDNELLYKNVYTGESMAVKSDQLYYLVPAEAIGVDEKTSRSLYNKNPLTKAEYETIKSKVAATTTTSAEQYVYVSDKVDISALGCSLQDFIKYDSATTKPEFYYHEVRVSDPSVGSLVYLYMLFDNEEKANSYFNMYYNKNEDSMKKYNDAYIDSIVLPSHTATFISAGNVFGSDSNDKVDGLVMQPETQSNAAIVLEGDGFANKQKFTAYCTKLLPNYTELKNVKKPCVFARTIDDDVAENQCVFENIIGTSPDGTITDSVEVIKKYIDDCPADTAGTEFDGVMVKKSDGNQTLTFDGGSEGIAVVTYNDSYTVSDDKIHLVISTGDVKVSIGNFEGIIICNGKLEFAGAVSNCKAAPDKVRVNLLYGYEKDSLTYTIASVLEGGNDFIYSNMGAGDDNKDTSLTGLVTYENWKKE